MLAENRKRPRFTPTAQVGMMLLHERSRPRGCHVRDYSENGVMLKCRTQEFPQQDVTLNVSDEVTIRFWDRSGPGTGGEVRGKITRIMK